MSTNLTEAETNDLLTQYAEAAESYWIALINEYDPVRINERVDILVSIERRLREGGMLKALLPLREHPSTGVRRCAASSTMELDKKGSIHVLEQIAQGEGPEAFHAGMALDILKFKEELESNNSPASSDFNPPLNGDPNNN